jgi:hypothetical protein
MRNRNIAYLGLACVVVALLEAGCASSPKQQLDVVEEAYVLVVNDETTYAKSAVANPDIVAEMKAIDAQIYPVIVRYRTAVEAGATPAKADAAAILAALSQVDTDLVNAKAIGPTTGAAVQAALSALSLYAGA